MLNESRNCEPKIQNLVRFLKNQFEILKSTKQTKNIPHLVLGVSNQVQMCNIQDRVHIYQNQFPLLNYNLNNFAFEKKVLEGTYTKNEKEKDINDGLRKKMIDFFKEDVKKLEKILKMKLEWF